MRLASVVQHLDRAGRDPDKTGRRCVPRDSAPGHENVALGKPAGTATAKTTNVGPLRRGRPPDGYRRWLDAQAPRIDTDPEVDRFADVARPALGEC